MWPKFGLHILCIGPTYAAVFAAVNGLMLIAANAVYESALTYHKNAFLFVTKTPEKVHKNARKKSTKTHRFKNRRCGSLAAIVTATLLFIMVVAATNTRPEHPNFERATDTISDLLKVRAGT